jgi:hypothetical protein
MGIILRRSIPDPPLALTFLFPASSLSLHRFCRR